MRKIINGKMYNTETAVKCGEWWNGLGMRDFRSCTETLYQKKTGEYFLLGEGGPMTEYARQISYNSCEGSWKVIPLTEEEARAWAEDKLSIDEYIELFGEPEE